jgi:hypothetical protein
MIDGFRAYPAMKESGVPWLGRVPAHWTLARLKSALLKTTAGFGGATFLPLVKSSCAQTSKLSTVDGVLQHLRE